MIISSINKDNDHLLYQILIYEACKYSSFNLFQLSLQHNGQPEWVIVA